mmetsp:Transcript_3974/g.16845  ORF Transcript_3974/g.16845 Transcript_3974/m.16845 type:complete len:103 (-) Transcript_3974:116-424(-)
MIAFGSPVPKPPRKERRWKRMCAVTRTYAPPEELFRIVRTRTADDKYVVALNEGNGRSVYILRRADVVANAKRKNFLGRILKCAIPPLIFTQMEEIVKENPP